jgi:hypothetical protein
VLLNQAKWHNDEYDGKDSLEQAESGEHFQQKQHRLIGRHEAAEEAAAKRKAGLCKPASL